MRNICLAKNLENSTHYSNKMLMMIIMMIRTPMKAKILTEIKLKLYLNYV